ncbi:MAG: dienelactone hydrolase family protein [Thermoplasmatota archaeon]
MGLMIDYARPDGRTAQGYYVEGASGANQPGIVVVQEWWGVNPQIKGSADRLAESGYRVLVPDLFRGKATLDAAEAEHLMHDLDFGDAATQDIRGAVQHLKPKGKVGVVGFCMGGALAVLTAATTPEADAVVSWYGIPPEEALDVAKVTVPLQGHFALHDTFFPIAGVDALDRRLRQRGAAHEFHRYDAGHAFGNETGVNHDPDATEQAWDRTLRFFGRHIG